MVHYLFAEGILSLREILRLLLLSGLFTVVCLRIFPHNAPSRRVFLLLAVATLVLLPWLLANSAAVWSMPLRNPPEISLNVKIPNSLALIWFSVAVGLVVAHLWAARREILGISTMPVIVDAELIELVETVAQQVHIDPPIVHSGVAACSTTLGSARIVLPAHWHSWDATTLRSVLLHESVHILRRDDRWLLLTRLLVLCYWWMPWLILLYRHYVRAMEESCDDKASELLGHDLTYVGALAHAAGVVNAKPKAYVNVTSMHEHHLVGRIGRFASTRVLELDTPAMYWWLTCVLVLVVALTSIEPVQLVAREQRIHSNVTADLSGVGPSLEMVAIFPDVAQFTSFAGPMGVAEAERLKNPLYSPPIIYPGDALRYRWEENVSVDFVVNADGSVSDAQVTKPASHTSFNHSALRVVRSTRYVSKYASMTAGSDRIIRRADHAYRTSLINIYTEKQPPLRIAQDGAHIEPIRIRRTFAFRLSYR